MTQIILNTIITAVVTAIITALFTYSRTLASASKSLKDGVLSLLRLMIIQSHDKYVEQEYCPLNEKEVIEKEIFGRGVPCDEFESLLGDYLLVSKGDAAFDYGEDTIMKSHHAGSSKEERDINLSLYNT